MAWVKSRRQPFGVLTHKQLKVKYCCLLVGVSLNNASVFVFCVIVFARQIPLTKGPKKKEMKQVPSAAKVQTIQINKRNTPAAEDNPANSAWKPWLNTVLHSDIYSFIF